MSPRNELQQGWPMMLAADQCSGGILFAVTP